MKLARSTVFVCYNHSTGFSNDDFSSFNNSTEEARLLLQTWHTKYKMKMSQVIVQAPVVQKLDNAIHRINHYPADSVVCFVNIYPLDCDLSSG